jgi:hypothetical protein
MELARADENVDRKAARVRDAAPHSLRDGYSGRRDTTVGRLGNSVQAECEQPCCGDTEQYRSVGLLLDDAERAGKEFRFARPGIDGGKQEEQPNHCKHEGTGQKSKDAERRDDLPFFLSALRRASWAPLLRLRAHITTPLRKNAAGHPLQVLAFGALLRSANENPRPIAPEAQRRVSPSVECLKKYFLLCEGSDCETRRRQRGPPRDIGTWIYLGLVVAPRVGRRHRHLMMRPKDSGAKKGRVEPGVSKPCMRQHHLLVTAGDRHGVPDRVLGNAPSVNRIGSPPRSRVLL